MATPYVRTSPSQISAFRTCKRRWFFGSILKLPQPQSPEAAEGEAMHKELEAYERHGTLPTHPSCLEAIKLDGIADSVGHEHILIEANTFECSDDVKVWFGGKDTGVILNGRIDRLDARDEEYPLVWDWKSKGKTLRPMSKKKLAEDPQLLTYAAWALNVIPTAKGVRLAHGYIGRDAENPYAKAVITDRISRETVLKSVQALDSTVLEMRAVSQLEDPMAVSIEDRDENACNAYGQRCPFYDRCFQPGNQLAAALGGNVSLLDKLTANNTENIPTPTPSTAPSATSTPAPTPGATSSTFPAASLVLYIDCVPEKGAVEFIRLEDEIAARTDAIIRAHNAKTLHDAPLNFGKGKDLLVESFRSTPPKGVVVATSAGLYAPMVLEVLKPLAPIVWRGF